MGRICEPRSANAHGVPQGHSPPPPGWPLISACWFVYAPVKRKPINLPKEEEAVDLTVPNTDTVDEAVVPVPKAPKLGVLVEPKVVGFETWLTPRFPNAEAEPEGVPNVNLPPDEGWLVEPNNAMTASKS